MDALKGLYGAAAIAASALLLASLGARARAQESSSASAPRLVVTILDGEGALNDIRQRTAREPIVEVDDENHRPVAGAAVLFTLPGSGPSGVFPGGAQTFSTVTDSAGRAVAHGLRPNTIQGSYNIQVKVTYNGQSAQTMIHQQNITGENSAAEHAAHAAGLKTVLIVVASAAAAGTVAVIVATRGGGSSPTTISPGPPTVGAPSAVAGIRFSLHGHNR